MNKKEIIKQGIKLYNKHYPNDKHTTKKEKENFVKFFIGLHDLKNKTIKILQSKVKTYEADIEADIKDGLHNYSYNNNCYCVKCKQYRAINKIDNKKLNKPIATLEIKN
tara:strand:- start:15 stop:341 length:327 start_codon:yes stop_codon:yes gene_type:complete